MSIVCGYDLKDANASETGLKNEASVQIKLQQAQELIEQMNEELSSIMENIEIKRADRDRKENLLWSLRMGNQYRHWYLMRCRTSKRFRYCGLETFKNPFDKESHKVHVEPTIDEQDELIKNLRHKLLHESSCLAEETKLIKDIKEAEGIKKTLVSNRTPDHIPYTNTKEINNVDVVYRAKVRKMKYKMKCEHRVEGDLVSAHKELESFYEARIRMNEKRSRVHRIIYDLVKQQDQQVPDSRRAENIVFSANALYM